MIRQASAHTGVSILYIKNGWQRAATRAVLSLMITVCGVGPVAAPAEPVRPPTPAGWFHVYPLDEHTYAISEPKYWQENVSYLLIGTRRALLFDTGPGIYSLRAAVQGLTSLPVIAIPTRGSGFRYQGVGSVAASLAQIRTPRHARLRGTCGLRSLP